MNICSGLTANPLKYMSVVDLKLCFMPQNVFNADKNGTDNVLDIWFAAFLKTKLCLFIWINGSVVCSPLTFRIIFCFDSHFRKLFKERKKQILSKNGKIKRTRYCTCSLEFPTLITWAFNSVFNFIFPLHYSFTWSRQSCDQRFEFRMEEVHVSTCSCYLFLLGICFCVLVLSTPKASERTLFIRIPFFLHFPIPAKPIDLLAQYVGSDDNDLEIQMHEPYTILVVRTFQIQCTHY